MGLDMFLNGYKLSKKLNPNCDLKMKRVYWRKANHIHKWFVDNIQNGIQYPYIHNIIEFIYANFSCKRPVRASAKRPDGSGIPVRKPENSVQSYRPLFQIRGQTVCSRFHSRYSS